MNKEIENRTSTSNFIEETDRVEVLAGMVKEIDDDYAELSARLNRQMLKFQDEQNQRFDAELRRLRSEIEKMLADVKVRFTEEVQDGIRKVSADEIAVALAKQILITRHATREEMQKALVTRQATAAELRNNQQNQQS
jgi:ferredoxin-fold anticodon binding domain-containing protein